MAKRPKPENPRPAQFLNRDEVHKLLAAASPSSLTGKRSRALIIVMWRGGLRCAEALALRAGDVDTKAGTIRVLYGKGAKPRTVGIDPEACAVIQAWIDARRAAGIRSQTLFCTLKGVRMDTETGARYVRDLISRLGQRAGIGKPVRPHGLRHTHASELAAEGVPINIIQKQLGHSNAGTTSIYIDHLMPQQVIDVMRARTWNQEQK